MKRFVLLQLIAAIFLIVPLAGAITVLPGYSFTPGENAPLAGLLHLSTDTPSRLSVSVSNDSTNWQRDFYDFSTNHSQILAGFQPGQVYYLTVTCYDEYRNPSLPLLGTFVTPFLPDDFPVSTLLTNSPAAMEPGYTLFMVETGGTNGGSYITMVDNSGQVVWYCPWTSHDLDVRQLGNGDLFLEQASPSNNFVEVNLLGNIVRTWTAPTNYPVNLHEGLPTAHGTILYLSDSTETVSNFPSGTGDGATLVTANVDDNPVVEISASNSVLLNAWPPLSVLDPAHITYLTYGLDSPFGVDNEHANAIIEDTNDNSLIISLRNENAVYKIARATGQLRWILGPPDNWDAAWQPCLLTPVGTPFDWNWGQHGPTLTPQHTLLVYNDGNLRASPPDATTADQNNYSSAEEFSINETNLTVSEIWNSAWQTNQDVLYTGFLGLPQWLPQTGNVLVTFGAVTFVNGLPTNPNNPSSTQVRLIEYTHTPVPQVVFDLAFYNSSTNASNAGYICYRSRRVPDFYAHQALPVVALGVKTASNGSTVNFTADPVCTYQLQASPDLITWTNLGAPLTGGAVGNYNFTDTGVNPSVNRFYRILSR